MICPICESDIDHLKHFATGQYYYLLFDDGDYEPIDFLPDGQVNDYECPECSATLTTNDDKANTMLKEGDKII